MFDLDNYLETQRHAVDSVLDREIPSGDVQPTVLHSAMRHAVFSGGKRIRPILCLAACEAAGAPATQAQRAAVAVEVLHTYTLVHDDLPCMDDDSERRGQPTVHVVFGEANAVLTGDAMFCQKSISRAVLGDTLAAFAYSVNACLEPSASFWALLYPRNPHNKPQLLLP